MYSCIQQRKGSSAVGFVKISRKFVDSFIPEGDGGDAVDDDDDRCYEEEGEQHEAGEDLDGEQQRVLVMSPRQTLVRHHGV